MMYDREPFAPKDLGVLFTTMVKFDGALLFSELDNERDPTCDSVEYLIVCLKQSYLIESRFLTGLISEYTKIKQGLSSDYCNIILPKIELIFNALNCSIEVVPTYINMSEPLCTIAQWRLMIGK